MWVALTFIGLPFVVRTLQPVLEDLQKEVEEAAAILGATRWQTFTRVILPILAPALLTGFALAFARALGEYGSVIFIAGNLPMISEITPLLIITKLEQFDVPGATAIAVVMLVAAFLMLLAINGCRRGRARGKADERRRRRPREGAAAASARRRASPRGCGASLIGVALAFLARLPLRSARRRLRRGAEEGRRRLPRRDQRARRASRRSS